MSTSVPRIGRSRLTRSLLVLLSSLALALSWAAVSQAATLNAVFDNTSPGASTGSAPFDADDSPGNDSSATNHIVRAHDTITYHWAISANGGSSPNTTITQELPEGMTWVNLPAYCLTGSGADPVSSLSADKRTIVCNTGTQGSSAVDYYPTAMVGGVDNGTTLTTNIVVSSSDPGTASVTTPPVTDTVSAAPRVNLRKRSFSTENVSRNGVEGVQLSYELALLVDGQGGKGMRGTETLDQPITFVDDISGYLPGAELIRLGKLTNQSGVPWSEGGGDTGVPQSGTWTGVQAAPGGNVAITITGADLSGSSVPTKNSGGNPLAADDFYLANQIITFFVPFDSIPDNVPIDFENVVRDFDPDSVTGQSNYGPGEETLVDNVVTGQYLKPSGSGSLSKRYVSRETASGALTNASGYYTGDGLVFPGQYFEGLHEWAARDAAPGTHHKPIICDNLDTSSVTISTGSLPPEANGQPAMITGTDASRWVIEYATGGTRGATPTAWYANGGPRDTTCADSDAGPGGWVTDPTTLPGGLDAVTSVRARAIVDATGIQYGVPVLTVFYKARTTDKYTGEPIVPGRKIANFLQFAEDADNDGTRTWITNTYDPLIHNNNLGAVATTAGGVVRIDKDTDAPGRLSALTGETVKYTLQPTATVPIPSGGSVGGFVMHDVQVVDTIPQHLGYVAGSASPAPASVVENPDGTTTLTWNLGDASVNGTLPKLTYDAKVKLTAPNGAQEVNTAVISSPDDPSSESARTDKYTIRIDKVFGIVIDKSTTTPWIETLDDVKFKIDYVNNAMDTVTSLDMIDVLPHNDDDRGADSAFHGTATLKSVTPADAGDTVYYTSRAADQVSNDPKNASNALAGGSTKWCTQAELSTAGCPQDVASSTAIRVLRTGNIAPGDGGSVELVLDTDGNVSGDRYVNDAGLAADGVTLPAFANPVEVRVVASNLGDYVWEDTDKDGLQDAGEPGIPGVKVTLTGTDKDGNDVDRSVVTDADGRYTFANADGSFMLRSGEYRLTFAKDGYTFTQQDAGSDDAVDSDADPATGRTGSVSIGSPVPGKLDQQDMTWDAGMIKIEVPPVPPPWVPPVPPWEPPVTPPAVQKHHALSIVKLANRKKVRAGQRVVYTLKVTASRNGNEDAVNEQLCDTLPRHLTVVSKGGGKLRNGKLCWSIKRLAPGKSTTKRFTVRVDRDAPAGRIVNVATVTDQGKKRTAKRAVTVEKTKVKTAAVDYVTG